MKDLALASILIGTLLASVAVGLGMAASGVPANQVAALAIAKLAGLPPALPQFASAANAFHLNPL
jgi:hypothetical protein